MKDSNSLPMYIRLADSTMKRFPDLSDKWDHEYGVVLKRNRGYMDRNRK